MDFCKAFNAETQSLGDNIIPVIITVYEDRSFSFITKTPPVSNLIKKELNIQSASQTPGKAVAGHLTNDQLKKIAEIKLPDLNTNDVEQAMKIVAGSARSMGITTDL
jgi:large subunit ribosomal protein L11